MIRIEEPGGWLLIAHRDHAHLAGQIASHWNNAEFAAPEPRHDILVAVARHDDAWAERDAAPLLTREGRPAAFSQELVGRYRGFEAIDLHDYLRVRQRATETMAAENPYAAIIVSMHTVNLLTEQTDGATLNPAQREALARFVTEQRVRQSQLSAVVEREPARVPDVEPGRLERAFKFLQVCDSLSLAICVHYPRALVLRHQHPRRAGALTELTYTPLGPRRYRVTPWPFDQDELRGTIPARRISGESFEDVAAFRAAYATADRTIAHVILER